MVKVTDVVPKIRLNEPLLRSSLSDAELKKVCISDEIDWSEAHKIYGNSFIIDERHLTITTNTGIESTLTSTDFLKYFPINLIMEISGERSNDIPFWEWKIFDNYVVITLWCGGPNGGLLVLDGHDKLTVIAATSEPTVVHPENIIFAPKHNAFICSGDLVGFDDLREAVDLTVITVDGRVVHSYIGLLEEGLADSGNAILQNYSGPSPLRNESWLKYVEEEDLLVFSILNDYRNKPLLVSCKVFALLKLLGFK
jgi:hypothetical protein